MLTKFVEILVISREKFFRTNSWEFPGNYSQDFLKSSLGISWNILSIFLSKCTNQGLGPIVVKNLTTILPLQPLRKITIFLSQNAIVVFELIEVVIYFVYSDNWIVKKKSKLFFSKYQHRNYITWSSNITRILYGVPMYQGYYMEF